VAPVWVRKLFRDFKPDELDQIKRSLGWLPLEPSCGTVDDLWARAMRGELGICILPELETSAFAAATIFEVVRLSDGSKQFESLCTVAIGPTDRNLTAMDMPKMESLAKSLGCNSMAMRTIRPALVQQLTQNHGWFASEITVRKILT
jgi:hypothetical protein